MKTLRQEVVIENVQSIYRLVAELTCASGVRANATTVAVKNFRSRFITRTSVQVLLNSKPHCPGVRHADRQPGLAVLNVTDSALDIQIQLSHTMLYKFPRPSFIINFFLNGRAGLHDRSFLGAGKRFRSSGCTSHQHPTSGQTVVVEKQGPVLTVGINRPEVRNAVNQETSQRLFEEFSAFEQDDTLSVAVLHGIGGNFCAGYDLKELSQDSSSLKLEQNVTQGPAPMGPSHLRLSKPLIAAVSGYAVAGGLELSLLADLRIVETSAIFGVFCRRFGVPLIDGGTVRLPRLIGLSRALDLILTGRPVGSQEALAFGLANRVVPDGQALQVAVELAEQISSFPQLCLRADRNSAYHASFDSSSFTQAMQYETDYGLPVITAEAIPGATRFSSGTGRGGTFS